MKYLARITAAQEDPAQLEALYRAAHRAKEAGEFASDLAACYAQAPNSLLYAAWHCRLQPGLEAAERASGISSNWLLAIPLSLVVGLIFALLADPALRFADNTLMPYLVLLWGPLAGLAIVAYLTIAAGGSRRRALAVAGGTVAVAAYPFALLLWRMQPQYRALMAIHLPLAAAIAVGLSVLGLRPGREDLFAVLSKAIEVLVTGGVYLIVGGMFAGIAFGMFAALGINISQDIVTRLAFAGLGAIAVLAVASVYDPRLRPVEQKFEQGLGKLVPTLTRLLLPLALLVLVIYIFVIPFRFMEPFRRRDVLIVFNAMLFGVMGLLVGVTPPREDDLPSGLQTLLRTGIIAVAALAMLISLYALSAVVYRTVLGGITLNRLTVIGWNTINIAILGLLLYKQARQGAAAWVRSLHAVAAIGIIGYIGWTLFLILVTPWLFS